MDSKVIQFDKNKVRYFRLADELKEKEDYLGALSLLFSVLEKENDYIACRKIAEIYALMEQFEASNLFWFRYLFYAPKNEVAFCYEELAINYFYLDNLWASGYYFHKKLSVDGVISKQNIDPEIMEFFSGEELKKHAFRLVYPYEMADYSLEKNNAKRAIRMGAFKESVNEIEKIPVPCRDEETLNDQAVSLMMANDLKDAEGVARFSIEKFGETVNSYCTLSTLFDMKKDYENADFYYQKALSISKDSPEDWYRIVSPAIERKDHEKANECLYKILKERPNEYLMRYFFAISFINLGNYESALRELKTVYLYNPRDFIVEYYINFVKELINGKTENQKFLPLEYNKELPKKEGIKWEKKIKDLAKNLENATSQLKGEKARKLLIYGMLFGKDITMRSSVMLLSLLDVKLVKDIALTVLLNPEVGQEVKKLLLYALVLKGVKGKIGVVAGSYYCEINLKKLLCEKKSGSRFYVLSYALCLSRMVFYGIDDFTKMVNATDMLFNDVGDLLTSEDVNNEELAGLILMRSGYENFADVKTVCSIFDVKQEKLDKLMEIAIEKRRKND